MDLFIIIFRTIFYYFLISISYRIMGKREVGQLGIIDLIVSILIAELVAISIENIKQPIIYSVIPIFIIVLIEIFFAYLSIKSKTFRYLSQGKPSILICNGRLNYSELVKQRYSLDDLLLSLREKQIKSISDVEYAFLESNGRLSVFKYENDKDSNVFPMPLITDGVINDTVLRKTKYSRNELFNILKKNKLNLSDVFYAFYKNSKIYIIEKDNKKTFLNNKILG